MTSITSIQALAAEKANCLITLSKAKRFEAKQVSLGRHDSKIYKAYEEAFKSSHSINRDDYEWLLKNGTPAGKIYGAMLLRGTDNADDKNSFGKLSKDESKIEYQSGCEIVVDTVSTVAKSFMKNGDYCGTKYLKKKDKPDKKVPSVSNN